MLIDYACHTGSAYHIAGILSRQEASRRICLFFFYIHDKIDLQLAPTCSMNDKLLIDE